MKKILIILGPTSTGKTSLGIHLAKKFSGEIVSADSRQIYRGMDIGTGKDVPRGSTPKREEGKKYHYYELGGVKLWCYDIADFKKDFSVYQYQKIARDVVEEISLRGSLPIVVGGTGFYIKALIDGVESSNIPQNKSLRKSLENRSPEELFEFLGTVDPVHAAGLNSSDKKNPRRLVRAIEIAQWKNTGKRMRKNKGLKQDFETLFIGLTADRSLIEEKIKMRVKERFEEGFEKEMKRLISEGFMKSPQAVDTLGYRQWMENQEKKGNVKEFLDSWKTAEMNYVKRQMTWFKKDGRVNWFDIGTNDYLEKIEKVVKKWYIGGDEKSSSKG